MINLGLGTILGQTFGWKMGFAARSSHMSDSLTLIREDKRKTNQREHRTSRTEHTVEYTKFMFLANQVMKFCIGGENLDTKLQVLPLPKTNRVSVYNNVRFIRSFESNYAEL